VVDQGKYMSEEAVKRKLNNAIDSLANKYPATLYRKIKIGDASCPFNLEIFRDSEEKGSEVFKFRVILDEITEIDIRLCQEYRMPGKIFTKIIACKSGRNEWKFKEIS